MKNHLIKRLLAIPIVLLCLSLIIFSFTFFLSPSERAAVFVNNPDELQYADLDDLIDRYDLDEPFYVQYARWMQGVASGDLGWSVVHRMPVAEALKDRIPATIELMAMGMALVFVFTLLLGTLAARNHNRWIDNLIRVGVTIGNSTPNFVIGIVLLIIFYVHFGILSPGRLSLAETDIVYSQSYTSHTGMHLLDSLLNLRPDVFWDALKHLILPSIAYAIGPMAAATRLMRSSMLENMRKGYADTARIKGLREKRVINTHVRRNAMIPTVTFIGMQIPDMLGGSVIIETIFNYPGMGMFIVKSAKGLDFAAIISASLAICLMIMVINLVIDMIYPLLNPRMRQE